MIFIDTLSEENEPVDPYVNILRSRGYEAYLVPTLEFEYHNCDVLKKKLQNPQNYSGMVITSPRCARGVIKCLVDGKLDENWRKKPIFVVGETTSRLLTNELDIEPIGANSGNAMALIPIILKYELTKSLLAPCGNMNINILSDNIKTVEFENIEVYRTIPHKNLKTNLDVVLSKINDQIGVVYFSPSGFRATCDFMPKQLLNQIHIFAIGPTTGAAINEAGYILSGICEKPKPESMINMIDTFIENTVLPK
ncbi:uroporphyrinogen-III synthase-like isoform X2 [Sipha flava]|uniref:Uroporphyrinogen-III synthase n=1 Tax=Sipha flava TaxID=143950 RepID=A0A8B8FM47_9HEMI|nr:uroporphyrinogen-III synthase-like isoform X2 [Sipha flava]